MSCARHRLGQQLKAIIHDDACHVARFSEKHRGQSELAKNVCEMSWVLDRFHCGGHRDPWCRAHCHPDVHPEITKNLNTSAAELVNSLIGRHKFVYRQMTKPSRKFFLQEVVDSRNNLPS